MNAPRPIPETPEQSEFVALLTSHQRRLFGYIATLLPNPEETEEVLQRTNLLLWQKAGEFKLGTSFRAWSFRVACLEVLAFRRSSSRQSQLFGAELVETISSEMNDFEMEPAMQALRACMQKLSARDRELVQRRYAAGATVKSLAESASRPESSIYRSLERIRYVLLSCIHRELASQGYK